MRQDSMEWAAALSFQRLASFSSKSDTQTPLQSSGKIHKQQLKISNSILFLLVTKPDSLSLPRIESVGTELEMQKNVEESNLRFDDIEPE